MKPRLTVERSQAQFQDSIFTYNQSGVTYNQSGVFYGGSDRVQTLGKVPQFVIEAKPHLPEVD